MTRSCGKWVVGVAAACALSFAASTRVQAAVIDCTDGCAGVSDGSVVNGALFYTTSNQSTGTGVIEPFLRIQANSTEDGHNTDASKPANDEKTGIWTHSVLVGDLHVETIGGTPYYEFLLDINQNTGGDDNAILSLDQVIICTGGATGDLAVADTCPTASVKYNLDTGANNWVKLLYDLNPGSGAGDLFMYIPTSLFAGVSADTYFWLYSQFGTNFGSNDGFEEWAMREPSPPELPPIPEPASMILFGVGLTGVARVARKRYLTR
jgi:PEP-CTERM motif-containing protein